MKLKSYLFSIFSLFLLGGITHAGEQDNWYIADEWTVPGAVGVFYDRNQTSGTDRLYVGSSQGVQAFEMNGTLIQTLFPAESSSWTRIPRSIAVDANGTVYYTTYYNLKSFGYGPGHVTSVTVDHNGSNYYGQGSQSDDINHFRLNFSGGNGTGASAYAVMDTNTSDTDSYNKFVTSVVVTDGGYNYTSETNATLTQNHSGSDYASFTVNLGSAWGTNWQKSHDGGEWSSIAIDPTSGDLFLAKSNQNKIQVFDKNGTMKREFGSSGSAPGQFSSPQDLDFMPDGTLVIADNSYLHFYDANGTFLRRTGNGRSNVSVAQDGTIFSYGYLRNSEGDPISRVGNNNTNSINSDSKTCFTPEGDLIESYDNKIRIWKRAYRTKGLPTPNKIPLPAIRNVSQRPGTNVVDIDFEIIDPDDANATVGLLGGINGDFNSPNQWIVPTVFSDGTQAKINAPIATNQVHRISWNVGDDWPELTGTLQFQILCQDARRNSPVDIHFLELPLADGNLTISRSPIKDSDFLNYFKFLLGTGTSGISMTSGQVMDSNGTVLLSSNGQSTKAGRDHFVQATGYRWASYLETLSAREASTPGTVNQWDATRPIVPRDLPNKVNEYGFDTGSHGSRAWWVVDQSTFSTISYTETLLDVNASYNNSYLNLASANGKLAYAQSDYNNGKVWVLNQITGQPYQLQGLATPTLTNSSEEKRHFGSSVAINGNTLAVGALYSRAPQENNGWNEAGSVHLFDLSGAAPVHTSSIGPDFTLEQTDYMTNLNSAGFGSSVLFANENLLFVGAPNIGFKTPDQIVAGNNFNYYSVGAVFIFKKNSSGTWEKSGYLSNIDISNFDLTTHTDQGVSNSNFGANISYDSGILAVGVANESAPNLPFAGAIHLYRVNSDNQVSFLGKVTGDADQQTLGSSGIMLKNNILVTRNTNQLRSFAISGNGSASLVSSINISSDLGTINRMAMGDYITATIRKSGSYPDYTTYNRLAILKVDGSGVLKLHDVIDLERQPNAVSTEGSTAILGYPGTKQLQILNISE